MSCSSFTLRNLFSTLMPGWIDRFPYSFHNTYIFWLSTYFYLIYFWLNFQKQNIDILFSFVSFLPRFFQLFFFFSNDDIQKRDIIKITTVWITSVRNLFKNCFKIYYIGFSSFWGRSVPTKFCIFGTSFFLFCCFFLFLDFHPCQKVPLKFLQPTWSRPASLSSNPSSLLYLWHYFLLISFSSFISAIVLLLHSSSFNFFCLIIVLKFFLLLLINSS